MSQQRSRNWIGCLTNGFASHNSLAGILSRFSLVGILATACYFLVANFIFLTTEIPSAVGSMLAYLAGMLVSFVGQSYFTFRVSGNKKNQALRFVILSVVGLLVSYFSVKYVVGSLNASPIWGTLLTAFAIPMMNFVVMKVWVFAPRKRPNLNS